jgi:hypothetical protein
LQEFSIPPGSPGLGRAATKTAMEAAKRASLENIVKMRVGGFASCELRDKDEVGIRIEETRITQRRSFISFFFFRYGLDPLRRGARSRGSTAKAN